MRPGGNRRGLQGTSDLFVTVDAQRRTRSLRENDRGPAGVAAQLTAQSLPSKIAFEVDQPRDCWDH